MIEGLDAQIAVVLVEGHPPEREDRVELRVLDVAFEVILLGRGKHLNAVDLARGQGWQLLA